ncbi:hypothetical protein IP84_16975 [beta proteobacterium AAP99]|nr:hypothetical protein IP84_16975 [beta proteobacterium AAP99]
MSDAAEQIAQMAVHMALADNAVLLTYDGEGSFEVRSIGEGGVPGAIAVMKAAIAKLKECHPEEPTH